MTEGIDELTRLRNRLNFTALLDQQIAYADKSHGALALIIIDIDGFSHINAANGYAMGDDVLRHMGRQLRQVMRKQDYAGRIGDNRFALLLPQVHNLGHTELAVHKLTRLLEPPLRRDDTYIAIRFTAGVALYPSHSDHGEYLLRLAEIALGTARTQGRRYQFAEATQVLHDLSDHWELEMQLGSAIENGELQMYYQPQVHIPDRRPIGAEALMRWHRSDGQVLSPELFIPLAERTGQIKKVTIWALNTVLRQAGEWRRDLGTLSVAVNLPGQLALQPDLSELVEHAMHLWGKDHIKLVLEISERTLMDRDRGRDNLMQLRNLGLRISIDDFGTGYSCLAYFKNIPADELKIDKSFVGALLTDNASEDITTLIINLAHRFGLTVVGEGVENERTLDMLENLGCDVAQGYLFGKAMPPDAFMNWLRAQQSLEEARGSGLI
ncbi:bifunctional diguanylate cyclase/phosphodiesterase [Oleiagrimonas sp.]|jgi:diguanylate cyclase (GGDEF)-like protein|uniref:putative bifunctional diguanylate cyclase/phosphodiesterase n=1 Tax=Oleiagrimonas sp. TaxID=2010330 RepID=UPI002629403A|nr:bifunctional diguanylate cyclase/phosphodiesterase [Oleiagrimonas sp.]MDA3912988.1 bifunctional diguanylate cyclase/phosphodiesterase [Oleiagrimonas sp.]